MQVPRVMQVSHVEVLERVSSILKNHGFFPTGECVNIGNLYFFSPSSSSLYFCIQIHGCVMLIKYLPLFVLVAAPMSNNCPDCPMKSYLTKMMCILQLRGYGFILFFSMLVQYPNSVQQGITLQLNIGWTNGKYFGTRDVIFNVLALVTTQGQRSLLAWVECINRKLAQTVWC